jgi:PAS domain S-box-containing protein
MVQPKRKKSRSTKSNSALTTTEKSQGSSSSSLAETNLTDENTQGGELVFSEVEEYAIMMMDVDGNIRSWNRGAEKIKGYTAKEIIGKNYRIFYTAEDKENHLSEKLLNDAREKGRASFEGWRVKKNGERFWGSMALTALHDKDGAVKGFLKVTRDLTEKKMAEDSYSNFVEELKLKNEELQLSEDRYHKMISEVVDYAIILLDRNGKILDWNKGAERLKGYSAKEIVGKNFRLFYPKQDKDNKLPESLLAQAEKNGSVIHEGWRLRKDGTRFWGNVTITALHDTQRNIIGFSKVTRDLTERKIAEDKASNLLEELRQANEHLKGSEERYQRMISEVQDYAIILLDPSGNVQNWNNGARLIKGYSAKEIIGKSFKTFYSNEDQLSGLPDQLLKEALRTGRVAHEGWRVRKDGTRFWGSVVITALHNLQGDLIGFSKVTRDLTERKFAEDALKTSAAQLDLKNKTLARLNDELASFTNIASHDLREPLRKIQMFAGRMKEVVSDPVKVQEYLEKVASTTARMQELIEDLLSYSEASEEGNKLEEVNLNNVITAVLTDLEVLINEKHAEIETGKLPVIKGVRHQLHQLFLNLISNAVKFTRPGVTPIVMIQSKLIKGPDIPGQIANGTNQYFNITVKDNGIGFDSQHANRIFEPFFRLHSKADYRGSGLGLAIVAKIVKNHNGIVNAESEPGVGSTFNIYLPKALKK